MQITTSLFDRDTLEGLILYWPGGYIDGVVSDLTNDEHIAWGATPTGIRCFPEDQTCLLYTVIPLINNEYYKAQYSYRDRHYIVNPVSNGVFVFNEVPVQDE